ncbi:MAG: prepilin-type N-terminal cleavage/methylation domain-containing protein [bacterium]|nr:prepilin-type N-terminal cleavage/methylation domain-containing protein [bacterium]
MSLQGRDRSKGFTLVELLIVVAIIGVIAAVAVPALLGAINRSRQSSTMTALRNIGQALQLYQNDFSRFPTVDGGTAEGVVEFLVPTYTGVVNTVDGWGGVIFLTTSNQEYTVISYGANGAEDAPYVLGTTTDWNADIVYSTGAFYQWPRGIQSN